MGWTRLSAGGRKRRVAVLVAGTGMGSQGWGASSSTAGDGDGRGPDNQLVDATLSRFGGAGGLFFRPPSIVTDLWMVMAWAMEISGRVIGVSR